MIVKFINYYVICNIAPSSTSAFGVELQKYDRPRSLKGTPFIAFRNRAENATA